MRRANHNSVSDNHMEKHYRIDIRQDDALLVGLSIPKPILGDEDLIKVLKDILAILQAPEIEHDLPTL